MTNDAWLNSLSWDIDNHLQSHNSVTFTYDALGRRLEKKTSTGNTLFICNGQRVVEEYTDDLVNGYQLARSYVYGSYIDDVIAKIEGGSTHYYHTDRQFNVRGLTDSTGAVVELYAYSVYGKQTVMDAAGTVQIGSAVNNFYGYTGRYLDSETGLWYFRARYFSDEMGRFINRDPLGYVDGMSLYNGYFAEMFDLDPWGMNLVECCGGAPKPKTSGDWRCCKQAYFKTSSGAYGKSDRWYDANKQKCEEGTVSLAITDDYDDITGYDDVTMYVIYNIDGGSSNQHYRVYLEHLALYDIIKDNPYPIPRVTEASIGGLKSLAIKIGEKLIKRWKHPVKPNRGITSSGARKMQPYIGAGKGAGRYLPYSANSMKEIAKRMAKEAKGLGEGFGLGLAESTGAEVPSPVGAPQKAGYVLGKIFGTLMN